MLPQKLVPDKELSGSQPSHNSKSCMSSEEPLRLTSKCSCSRCDSIDCFKIRNQNSNLLCTCKDCRTCTLHYNNSSNKKYNINLNTNELEDSSKVHNKSDKSKIDFNERVEYKDITHIIDKVKKREDTYKKSYTRNYSVSLNYSRNDNVNSTDKLSAQVMNLSYEEFKDSLTLNKRELPLSSKKVTKSDILTKLKEMYKACSCKVCECITGKPCFSENIRSKNGTFDSENTNAGNNTQYDINQLPHSGCPCVSCDRKDCQGVVKNTTGSCDCEPCDCVKVADSLAKPCECEPCQCSECTQLNYHMPHSIIVAPVQENFYQNLCQCAPCECVNCTQSHGTVASSLMLERSTDMVPNRNCECGSCVNSICQWEGVDCRCDTQSRIMRKPIDRSSRNYDLYRALNGDNTFNRKQPSKIGNCDTIAMFAFSNDYSNTVFNKSRHRCQCTKCECIECWDKEKNGYKFKNSYILHSSTNVLNNSFKTCNCQPCECKVCCKVRTVKSSIQKSRAQSNCICDICDCVICRCSSSWSENNRKYNHRNNNFENVLADSFENCKGFSESISKEISNPLKQGKLFTTSMFETEMLSQSKSQLQLHLPTLRNCSPCKSILTDQGKKLNKKNTVPQSITICNTKSLNEYNDSVYNHSMLTSLNKSNLDIVPKNTVTNTLSSKRNVLSVDNKKILKPWECLDTTEPMSRNNFGSSDACQKKDDAINLSLPKKCSTSEDGIMNLKINYNQDHPKRFERVSKVCHRFKGNEDLFCATIISFEKSIAQLKEDISQNRKVLAEFRSSNKLGETFYDSNAELSVCNNVYTNQSLMSLYETNIVDNSIKLEISEEPDKIQNSEKDIVEEIINSREVDRYNYNDNSDIKHNFSYNKMYKKLIMRTRTNVSKMRKTIGMSSKIYKSSKKLSNKINKFVNKNPNLKLNTISTSASYKSCSVDCNQQCFQNEIQRSLTAIGQGNDQKEWSVLKKNLNLAHLPLIQDKSMCTIPELEVNVKLIAKSISLQTTETRDYTELDKLGLELKYITVDASSQTHKRTLTVEKEVNFNIEKSIDELSEDMKHLLDLILIRTVCKSELTRPLEPTSSTREAFRMSKIDQSVYGRCDGLKASFVDLKRVSDHTVLVKWKMPRDLAEVQGYELQVDGRAVQKILSPTRCMAILTCLPNCDKLPLTIRTLTFSALPSGRHPAATIIYSPRKKLHTSRALF